MDKRAPENGHAMIHPIISQFNGVDDADMANIIAHYLDSISHIRDHFLGCSLFLSICFKNTPFYCSHASIYIFI